MMDEIGGRNWGEQVDKSLPWLATGRVWSLLALVAWMVGWGMKCVNEWRGAAGLG